MDGHRTSVRVRLGTAVAGAIFIAAVAVPVASAYGLEWIDTSLTLQADHVGGFQIGSDGITLDCAGHSLIGDGTGTGVFMDGRTGVTIRNCVATAFFRGFELHGSSNNLLSGNTASGSVGDSGNGFFIADASNSNVLENNTAIDNGLAGTDVDGFRVQDSDGNVLRDNVARRSATWGFIVVTGTGNRLLNNLSSDNDLLGFAVHGARSTTLVGNAARNNGTTGFATGDGSQSSTFRNNVAANNGNNGFQVDDSANTVFAGNESRGNGTDGIVAGNANGVTVTANSIEDSGEHGLIVFDSTALTASRNVIRGSRFTGIQVERAPGAQLTGNTVESNTDSGFQIVDSDAINASGNVARSNGGSGFAIFNGVDGRYVGNTLDRNLGEGLFAIASASMLVSRNAFTGNGDTGNGFVFIGVSDSRVESNVASGAAGQCFGLYDGTHATSFTRNTASDCGAGFDVWNSTDNTFSGNTASRNTTGPGFNLGPNAARNVLSANVALGNLSGFQLSGDETGGPNHNLLTGNVANSNLTDGFSVRAAASDNTILRNRAHGNVDWDAIQGPDAGAGNVWYANSFGVTAGF